MQRMTRAICPKCYQSVPAFTDGNIIRYACNQHGSFASVTDPDLFFIDLVGHTRQQDIFNALTINITNECNDNCPLCYYPCGKGHMPLDEATRLFNAYSFKNIWLSGGEPTTHPDLFQMMQHPSVTSILTNGIKFADISYFDQFLEATGLDHNGCIKAVISIQPSHIGIKERALRNARKLGVSFNCAMFSVESLADVVAVLRFWNEWADVIHHARIRTPFCSWGQEADKSLYLSDIMGVVAAELPEFSLTDAYGGNSIYSTAYQHGNRVLFTCCAPHPAAFDVDAVQTAPQMLANDGKAYPIPQALVINQGIAKGLIVNPIDVVIMTRPTDDPVKMQRCLESLHNEPVNIHIVPGIQGAIGRARVDGFTTGHAEWVSFVDPDDEIIPGIYSKLLKIDADCIYCNELVINETNNKVLYGWSYDNKNIAWIPPNLRHLFKDIANSTLYHHRGIFRRSTTAPYLSAMADKHEAAEIHFMKAIADGGKTIIHCPEFGYIWNLHGRNTVLEWI